MELLFKNIEDEVIANRDNLENYIESIKLLHAFSTEPDNVIELLAKKDNAPLQDIFITALQNKDGKLTRASTLDQCKTAIVTLTKTNLEKLDKGYRPIYKRWSTIIEATKAKFNLINNHTCLHHLEQRIDKYLSSPLTRQVYSPKVEDNINMYIAKENLPYNGKEYLRRIMLRFVESSKPLLTNIFKNFRRTIEVYNKKIDYNKLMFTKSGTSEFNIDKIEETINSFKEYNPIDRYNDIFVKAETNVSINPDTKVTEIKYGEVFNDIMDEHVYCVDILKETIKALKYIEKYIKLATEEIPQHLLYDQAGRSTQTPDTSLTNICNGFHYKAVVPYAELKLTRDQFFNAMSDLITIVNNLIALEYEIMVYVSNALMVLYTEIDTLLKVFNTLDGATVQRVTD